MDADSDFNGCQLAVSVVLNENIGRGYLWRYKYVQDIPCFQIGPGLGWCVDRDVLDPGGGGAVEEAVHESSCESTMCGIIVPITDARGITHRSCDGAITGFAIDDASIRPAVALWLSDRAAAISTYGDISTWETSGVTDMSSLFSAESSFNEDISAWDTSGVTDMDSMFEDASAFNQPLSDWRVDKVTSMHEMFSGASTFDQELGWCVSDGVDRVSALSPLADVVGVAQLSTRVGSALRWSDHRLRHGRQPHRNSRNVWFSDLFRRGAVRPPARGRRGT